MYRAGAEYPARFSYGNEVVEDDGVTLKKDAKNLDPALRSGSVKGIVFINGLRYQDTSSLDRAFREWEGVTPNQWRELNGRPTDDAAEPLRPLR